MQSDISLWAITLYCSIVFAALVGCYYIICRSRGFQLLRVANVFFIIYFFTYFFRVLLEYGFSSSETLLQYLQRNYEPTFPENSTVVYFGIQICISIIAFTVGYLRLSPRRMPSWVLFERLGRGAHMALGALYLIGIFAIFSSNKFGGMVKTELGAGMVGTTGYMFLMSLFVPTVSLVAYTQLKGPFKLLAFVLFLPFGVALLSSGHARFLGVIWAIAITFLWIRGNRDALKKRYVVTLAVCFIFGLVGFNMLSYDRQSFTSIDRATNSFTQSASIDRSKYFFRGFAGFEGGILTLQKIQDDTDSFRWGTEFLYKTLVMPVPRMLWNSKPYPVEFTWSYILSFGSNTEIDYQYAMFFEYFFVRGAEGTYFVEMGFMWWIYPLITGLAAGFVERKVYANPRGALRFVFCAIFFASFVMLGRNTLYDYIPQIGYGMYFPLLLVFGWSRLVR